MIAMLQWVTLAACTAVTIARIPSAMRGENRSLFCIFALITLAILLSIEGPYLSIDQAIGGMNIANLLLRFIVFGVIFFLGVKITRGFGATREYRLLIGKVGLVTLGICSVAVSVAFLLTDTAGSSVGMRNVADKNAVNAVLVEFYGAAGRLYPAYVSLLLVPVMARAVRSNLPVLVRAGALLLGIGSVAIILTLSFPWLPPELATATFITNYTAILCFVAGLAVIWLAKLHAARRRNTTFTGK